MRRSGPLPTDETPAAVEREDGFLLLDAVTAVFVLSVGFFSAVYGMSVFLRSVDRLERQEEAYIGHENARTDAWFRLPDAE